jgi:hypothetical protein
MNYLTKVVQYVTLQLEVLVYITRTKSVRHGQLQGHPTMSTLHPLNYSQYSSEVSERLPCVLTLMLRAVT